ncbi:hypothetical protein ACQY0O_007266 [Thecaphora frezii]
MRIPWTPTSGGLVRFDPAGSSRPPRTLVPQRQKRVLVTSCDACRLRKLRCNAKELPRGTSCSNCAKSELECTFEDFKESMRPIIRPRARRAVSASKASARLPPSVQMASAGSSWSSTVPWLARSTASKGMPASEGAQPLALQGGPIDCTEPRLDPTNLSSSTADLVEAIRLGGTIPSHSEFKFARRGPWDEWALPTVLTHPVTGESSTSSPFATVSLLLERFYAKPTVNAIVLSYEELFRRLDALLAQQGGVGGRTNVEPIPSFLLLAAVVVAAGYATTNEPEIMLWRQYGRVLAIELINARLQSGAAAQIDVMQALLLLSIGWSGEPDSADRLALFETAVNHCFELELHSCKPLESPISQADRAKRICLYWMVYVVDKMVAAARDRPGAISRNVSDIPLPSLEDILVYGSSNLTSHTTTIQEAQGQLCWIHSLALCLISLAQILEDVQAELYLPSSQEGLYAAWHPWAVLAAVEANEQKLEGWCKSNSALLQAAAEQGEVCQSVTDAIVAQLHLVQLQLYQRPLRLESNVLRSQGVEAQAMEYDQNRSFKSAWAATVPLSAAAGFHLAPRAQFSAADAKALTACIESAHYLVQHGDRTIRAQSCTIPIASLSSAESGGRSTYSVPTALAVLKATQFLEFLDRFWDGGHGGLEAVQLSPTADNDAFGAARCGSLVDAPYSGALWEVAASADFCQTVGEAGHQRTSVDHSADLHTTPPACGDIGASGVFDGEMMVAAGCKQRRNASRPLPLDLNLGMVAEGSGTESCLVTCASLEFPVFSATSTVFADSNSTTTDEAATSFKASPPLVVAKEPESAADLLLADATASTGYSDPPSKDAIPPVADATDSGLVWPLSTTQAAPSLRIFAGHDGLGSASTTGASVSPVGSLSEPPARDRLSSSTASTLGVASLGRRSWSELKEQLDGSDGAAAQGAPEEQPSQSLVSYKFETAAAQAGDGDSPYAGWQEFQHHHHYGNGCRAGTAERDPNSSATSPQQDYRSWPSVKTEDPM